MSTLSDHDDSATSASNGKNGVPLARTLVQNKSGGIDGKPQLALPSTWAKSIRKVQLSDCLLDIRDYLSVRQSATELRRRIKKPRRFQIGPFATVLFENYDLIWFQIHEMVAIEKGQVTQFEDELLAYNPLIPQGDNLVATLMLEIDNPQQRARALSSLGHIENATSLSFRFSDSSSASAQQNQQQQQEQEIKGTPILTDDHVPRTDETRGKTSAVHFLEYRFTPQQIQQFQEFQQKQISAPQNNNNGGFVVEFRVDHPQYRHSTVLSQELVALLCQDLHPK